MLKLTLYLVKHQLHYCYYKIKSIPFILFYFLRWSSEYFFCCHVYYSETVKECLPKNTEFSSCDDLICNEFLRTFMWILGISAVIGNSFVIFWRLYGQRSKGVKSVNTVQSLLVSNLAVADLLMGVYMLIIAIADKHFRYRYAFIADDWKASFMCKFAGFLSVLSSETSVLFLTVISLDRYVCISFPFSQWKLTRKSARYSVIAVWAIGFVISFIPAVVPAYFGDSYYGRSNVCLALPLSTLRPAGWQYSVTIFLAFNLVLFLTMLLCYCGIFYEAKASSRSVRAPGELQRNQMQLALRMAFLIGTDFACWVPIIICGFISLSGHWELPIEIYGWAAVFILPLNSSLNPYLYTILTREMARKRVKKETKVSEEISSVSRVLSESGTSKLREKSTVGNIEVPRTF